jgi:hypothetical protein
MKIIIAGSRTITEKRHVYDAVRLSGFEITEVVSGKAPKGGDFLGETWANENGVPVTPFPADWTRFPHIAGFLRNIEMGDYAQGLIALWDGMSSGTAHMIATAYVKHLPTYVHMVRRSGRTIPQSRPNTGTLFD